MDSPAPSPYDALLPLMRRCQARLAPREFYWAVNEAFHTAESRVYDVVHAGMFSDGLPMWRRLLEHLPPMPARRSVLDVGAGTGLVGGVLAKVAPDRIGRLTLLDPNQAMLDQAAAKAASWPFEVEARRGLLDAVAGRRFDLVTVSSVLHHVVELEPFCAGLAALLEGGGLLLQMHDPRSGAEDDAVLEGRRRAAAEVRRAGRPAAGGLRRLASGALRALGRRPRNPLADATNEALLRTGAVRRPLAIEDVWAVTDFHVPGQPGAHGHGVDCAALARWMPELQLIDTFTYEFFGTTPSQLAPAQRAEEARLWESGDGHGALFGSAWARR